MELNKCSLLFSLLLWLKPSKQPFEQIDRNDKNETLVPPFQTAKYTILNCVLSSRFEQNVYTILLNKAALRNYFLCISRAKHKKLKRTLFTVTKHNMRIFGVSPLFKLQNTWITVKRWKMKRITRICLWLSCFVMCFRCPVFGRN